MSSRLFRYIASNKIKGPDLPINGQQPDVDAHPFLPPSLTAQAAAASVASSESMVPKFGWWSPFKSSVIYNPISN